MSMETTAPVYLYESPKGQTELQVRLQEDTVWLSLNQMADLFDRDKSVISRHIRNVYQEGEISKSATVAKFATVQHEGGREVERDVEFYNLDVIISVGYRVKSKQGTQFRIWANGVLKDYLVRGYAINEKLLQENKQHLQQLQKTLQLISQTALAEGRNTDERDALLKLIQQYAYGLDILDQYDHQRLSMTNITRQEAYQISYEEAMAAIRRLGQETGASTLFGREKDASFPSSLTTIYQTFDSEDLYPSLEEKAANLLYLVVKNHSFTDGNKRIAAYLFLVFLERNKLLYNPDGSKRLADNALVGLTLLIAESRPEEKDMIVKLVVNLINQNN